MKMNQSINHLNFTTNVLNQKKLTSAIKLLLNLTNNALGLPPPLPFHPPYPPNPIPWIRILWICEHEFSFNIFFIFFFSLLNMLFSDKALTFNLVPTPMQVQLKSKRNENIKTLCKSHNTLYIRFYFPIFSFYPNTCIDN